MWRLILKVNCKRRSRASWAWDGEAENSSIKQVDWVLRASVSLLTQLLGSSSRPGFSPFSRKCDQPKRKDLKILTLKVLQANGSAAITHSMDSLTSLGHVLRASHYLFSPNTWAGNSRVTEENLKLERERSTNWPQNTETKQGEEKIPNQNKAIINIFRRKREVRTEYYLKRAFRGQKIVRGNKK